jgi:predicted nucleotidyltransferase
MKTDWQALSKKLGVLKDDNSESYAGINSSQALEDILGDEWIRDALETFIAGKPGNELAIKTIRFIGSERAAKMAYEIYTTNKNTHEQRARLAIWAMNDIRMTVCMDYVEEFLQDKRYRNQAVWLLKDLVFDTCLAFDENRLYKIFDSITDEEHAAMIGNLRTHTINEFKFNKVINGK